MHPAIEVDHFEAVLDLLATATILPNVCALTVGLERGLV